MHTDWSDWPAPWARLPAGSWPSKDDQISLQLWGSCPRPQYCVCISQAHLEICYFRHRLLCNFHMTALEGTKLHEFIRELRSQELIMYLISLLWIIFFFKQKYYEGTVVKLISGWDFPSSRRGLSLRSGIWARHPRDALQCLPWLVLLTLLLKAGGEHTQCGTQVHLACCCCSVAKSCPTICHPMDCSTRLLSPPLSLTLLRLMSNQVCDAI